MQRFQVCTNTDEMVVPPTSNPQYLVNTWSLGVLFETLSAAYVVPLLAGQPSVAWASAVDVGAVELEVPVVDNVPVVDALVGEVWGVVEELETDDRWEATLEEEDSLCFPTIVPPTEPPTEATITTTPTSPSTSQKVLLLRPPMRLSISRSFEVTLYSFESKGRGL